MVAEPAGRDPVPGLDMEMKPGLPKDKLVTGPTKEPPASPSSLGNQAWANLIGLLILLAVRSLGASHLTHIQEEGG